MEQFLVGSAPLHSNLSVLIKLGIIFFGSIGLIMLAMRQSNKGQMKGWKHFCKLVEKLNKGEITEDTFNKMIKERR